MLPEYLRLAGVWDGADGMYPIALILKLIPPVAFIQKCQSKHLAMGKILSSLFLLFTPPVLHYGPLEFSRDQESETMSYLHEIPDDSWKSPDKEDPLSVVDKVTKQDHTYTKSIEKQK